MTKTKVNRSHLLPQVRVTPEEDEVFREAAARAGMSLGAWLRLLARRAAGLPTEDRATDGTL